MHISIIVCFKILHKYFVSIRSDVTFFPPNVLFLRFIHCAIIAVESVSPYEKEMGNLKDLTEGTLSRRVGGVLWLLGSDLYYKAR